tara:strand:- start:375 stop:1190 length:816 start_codon:yes stop_codon:yes gene_type:complete
MTEKSPPPAKKSGLMLRVLSALVMLPIAIFIILQGGVVYQVFVALFSILILFEWNGICEKRPLNAVFYIQALLILMIVFDGIADIPAPYVWGGLLVSLVPVAFIFRIKPHYAVLGALYAAVPAASMIWLRETVELGGFIVLWCMIIVWSMDTGAYFAGKNIGGPKLAPRISPNKTWAGLVGGALTAVITGLIAGYYFDLAAVHVVWTWQWGIPIAAGLAIWSQIGDLFESALKRHFAVKDSGAIIPGHGGIMDRVDGVVFAAPVVALFLYL